MKARIIFLTALFLFFGIVGCSKDDAPDHLPPATQTGAGIFACLVNGEVFVHEDGVINCFYQYVDGGYYFSISGRNFNNSPGGISVGTINKPIEEGQTYILLAEEPENAIGVVFFQDTQDAQDAVTNQEYTGELTITKLDFENQIVSGTFWFNLKHPITGDTIKIRQGRFDSHFYQ